MVRRGTGHGPAGGEKTPELPRQYVNFAFYRVDPAWRRLPQREREVGKKEFKGVVEEYAPEMLILPYTLVGGSGRTRTSCCGASRTIWTCCSG